MNKHRKYLSYVVRHKWFVFVAGRRIGVSWWRLLKHDWHKFLPSEWCPYVEYFYGEKISDEEVMNCWRREQAMFGYRITPSNVSKQNDFDRAWNLHQKRADHHWQFWLLTMDSGETHPIPMSHASTLEMVADWYGAGKAIAGKWEADVWYQKNKDRMNLNPITRLQVEGLFSKSQDAFGKL